MASVTAVSVDEYLKTSYEPNCEYIDGILVRKPMPTSRHSKVQGWIIALIYSRFPGFWVGAELAVQVRHNKFLVPDVAVQDGSDVQEPYPIRPILLCVEVLSPDDSLNQTIAKCGTYHEWGTLDTWIIDPVAQRAWQYTKGSAPEEIEQSGELRAGAIHLPLADIFR